MCFFDHFSLISSQHEKCFRKQLEGEKNTFSVL